MNEKPFILGMFLIIEMVGFCQEEQLIFKIFLHDSKSQYFFSNLNYNCSDLLYLRNIQEQVKKAF